MEPMRDPDVIPSPSCSAAAARMRRKSRDCDAHDAQRTVSSKGWETELSIPEYVRNNTQTGSTSKPNRNLTRGEPLEDKCKGVTFSWVFNVMEPSTSGRFSYFDRSGGTHREYVVQPSSQEAQGRESLEAYLLYGPPGTGKSSLIAAIANYTQYDDYDMELTEVKRNARLEEAAHGDFQQGDHRDRGHRLLSGAQEEGEASAIGRNQEER
ncbi:hypothetical protein SELMODRAFT_407065 [Selaginella moellendorffii]|uniref:ATPase AAA-type core domain-containing protein n=1 Tax=Selaginella moellendorffii TaxID=88036 RepID=D8R3T4_SELML|nr:hypothetical protein SELMODRAFT_407065 [Selaginella moellendorffii]